MVRKYKALQVAYVNNAEETTEGLDKKLSLHYYARLRFVQNLLPLLNNAAAEKPAAGTTFPIARVFSVLGGGEEGKINVSDLSLKHNFSLSACATHAITMNTLSMIKLATANPRVTFVHSQPGGVETNAARDLPGYLKPALKAAMFLARPWTSSAAESGERHAWYVTTDKFGDGGAYRVDRKNEIIPSSKILDELKSDGTVDKVWDHTEKVYKEISQTGKYDEN
jgi:hypothetical protein